MAKNTKRKTTTSTKGITSKNSKTSTRTLNGGERRVKGDTKLNSGCYITQRDRFAFNDIRSLKNAINIKGNNQHVVPYDGAWAVRKEGSNRATIVFEVKSDAIDAARKIARSQGADLIIHGRSGQIFQRSDARSSISEKKIRDAIRTSAKKTTSRSSTTKKSSAKGSSKSKSNKK
jgi:Uncharacterized protein conserved in bacteria (DUF2188)